jgi:hypothetical protein
MGAWGVGIFENDTAADFVHEIVKSRDFNAINASLSKVVSSGIDYLEAPDAEEALVAAEVVFRAKFSSRDQGVCSEQIEMWVKENASLVPSDELVVKAKTAVSRVLTEPSELLELWQESDEFNTWKNNVESLLARLT